MTLKWLHSCAKVGAHIWFAVKIILMGFLGPFRASCPLKTIPCQSYCKGEVWNLLSTLEVPYTHDKDSSCQNHI